MSERHANVGRAIEERLLSSYGFELESASGGRWLKKIDDQHAVIVSIGRWSDGSGNRERGSTIANVVFHVARRDMNEAGLALIPPFIEMLAPLRDLPWRATISEPPQFFGQDHHVDGIDAGESEAMQWVDTWVPRLIDETPSFGFIECFIDSLPPDRAPMSKLLLAMVRGWTEEDEETFIGPWHEVLERLPPEHDHHRATKFKMNAVRKWIAEYPNGLHIAG